MKLYNTRTRTAQEFAPLRAGDVRIYVCGLTPSAQAHLGHARSFLFFDVLRRYLEHRGYRVTYVQNVTDIDDRSINAAKATGGNYHDIVEGFYAEFKGSMRTLGVREYDFEPYATQYIEPIQTMIRELIEGGHAYVTQDGIYYRWRRSRTTAAWPTATSKSWSRARASRLTNTRKTRSISRSGSLPSPASRAGPSSRTAKADRDGTSSVRRCRARCSIPRAPVSTSTAAAPT